MSTVVGTTTSFEGNILALDSITLTTGAKIICGRALAQNAAVTMDTNTISNNCSAFNNGSGTSDFGSAGFSGSSGIAAIPEPGTIVLLSVGFLSLAAVSFRRKRVS